MQNELSKKNPRKWYHIGLPRLEGAVNGLRYLSDSQVVPLQIPIASLKPNKEEWSYRRKTISNRQSNKTLHYFSTSTEQLEGRQ